MRVTEYRGVRIKVKKGREWGYLNVSINGRNIGDWQGTDEEKMTNGQFWYIDLAIAEPERMADYWQPGWKPERGASAVRR